MESKHGRGDWNDRPPYTPTGSTSFTVNYPPGYSPGSGLKRQYNPLRSRFDSQAFNNVTVELLPTASTHGLIRYLEENQVPHEVACEVAKVELTGAQWVGLYGQVGDEAAAAMMADFEGLSSFRARVLTVDAKAARRLMDQAEQGKADKARAKLIGSSATTRTKYKIESAPKLTAPANRIMYASNELTTIFSKILLWIAPKSPEMAQAMKIIQHDKVAAPTDVYRTRQGLSKDSSMLDEELAAELVAHLPKCLEIEIIKVRANHMVDDRASSLRIMQALKERVEKKTKSRGSNLLYGLLCRQPCASKQNLQQELIDIKAQYQQLERMDCTPQDADTVLHPVLVHAMEILQDDVKVGPTVLAKMAAVDMRYPGDAAELNEMLTELAAEWSVDYADNQTGFNRSKLVCSPRGDSIQPLRDKIPGVDNPADPMTEKLSGSESVRQDEAMEEEHLGE